MDKGIRKGDVVQFNETHKWVGCLGIVTDDRGKAHPRRYLVGIKVPEQGTAYIFDSGDGLERIGTAVLVEDDD